MAFERKSKKMSMKQKAEFEFNKDAAPISLKTFFNDLLEATPDEIDTSQPITGSEEFAPVLANEQEYPANSDELAPQLLDLADNFLQLSDKLSNPIPPTNNQPDQIVQQLVELTTMDMIKDVKKESIDLRIKTKNLSAKRFAFKALQLFSFNPNYGKHFTMDKFEIRRLNPDMIVDTSEESVQWLQQLGNYYKNSFLNDLGFADQQKEDQFLLNNLQNTSHFKALGYSIILKNLSLQQLTNPFVRLDKLDPQYFENGYSHVTISDVFKYFRIKMFGLDSGLDFQLNYLHLIPHYSQSKEKKKIFTLFQDLDFKSVYYEGNKINISNNL